MSVSPDPLGNPSLDSADPSELESYQAISGWAIASLILGLLSPLALTQPTLWLIPLGGLLVSLSVLRRRGRESSSSQNLATFGLISALFFGTLAPARLLVREAILRNSARHFAAAWMELVQLGRLRDAHQWTLSASTRIPRADLVDAFYREHPESQKNLERLFAKPGLRELVQAGKKATIRLDGTQQGTIDRSREEFVFNYIVEYDSRQTPLAIAVSRFHDWELNRIEWTVGLADTPAKPSGPPLVPLP